MSIDKELNRIDEIGAIAWQLAQDGDFRQARSLLKKIRGSFCVSESDRVVALVEAKILAQKGDFSAAKQRLLDDNYILWSAYEGLEIISYANPPVDTETSHYYIEVLGGLALLGIFSQMSEDHIGSFDVLANSANEALHYIDEICRFGDPTAKLVLTCVRHERAKDGPKHRGVFETYPFRLHEGGLAV